MSQETQTISRSRSRASFYAALSFAVTSVAAFWFVVEVSLATGWRDAMVFHDAGLAVALVAVLLAVLALGTSHDNRRASWLALGLAALAFAFFLLVLPL